MKLSEVHIRDPFILVFDGKYYMYGTRGKGCWDRCSGFDVYVSLDMENWSNPISVFEKNPDFWGEMQFWAPEVHSYNGKFYMLATFAAEGKHRATHILQSDTPDGQFVPLTEAPITPLDWECLDGTLYISKSGDPYLVFCHEWTQVKDGEICAVRLSEDLTHTIGSPWVLFKGSDPDWANGDNGNFVTDGPFLIRNSEQELFIIWSTINGKYVEAQACSDNGEITGNWKHSNHMIFNDDGGHGMIFKAIDGSLKFIMHKPNISPNERPQLFDIKIDNGVITLK